MKRFSILTLIILIALSTSACGAQATPPPTVDVLALQSTAAAVALTMIAETEAAIPTATTPPTATITNTPAPTNTFPALPPAGVTFTPVPNTNSGGGDPCVNAVLPATLVGETIKMRLNNSTKATLSVTVYLNQTAPQNVCGYRAYTLEPGQFLVLNNLVEGCYTLWAWNPDPEEYFIVTNGTDCLDNSLDSWVFDISTGSIRLRT
jgi:hypothetical protein